MKNNEPKIPTHNYWTYPGRVGSGDSNGQSNKMVDFLIVATGYNCADNVQRCYNSIVTQEYPNVQAVLIDDGSTDNTWSELLDPKYHRSNIARRSYPDNMGAAYRRWYAIKEYEYLDKETVIILLGLDDELLPGALNKINEQYQNGAWVTYGNWMYPDGTGLPEHFELEFCPTTNEQRNYRKVKYRSTAPNTFKKFLFDTLDESEFKYNGEWIKATTESNLMFSCLEMSGPEHIKVIKEPIYLYRFNSSKCARNRFGPDYQKEIYNDVINKDKKELYERGK